MRTLKARSISLESVREVSDAEACLRPICEADYRDTMLLATCGDQTYHSIADIPKRRRLSQSSTIYYKLPGNEVQRLSDEAQKQAQRTEQLQEEAVKHNEQLSKLNKQVVILRAEKVSACCCLDTTLSLCNADCCMHTCPVFAPAHPGIAQAEQLFLTTYRDPLSRWFEKVAKACSLQPGFPAFGHTWGDLAGWLEDEDNLNEPDDRPVTSSLKGFLSARGVNWQQDWLPLRELSSTATGACHQGKRLSWRRALADLQAGTARVPDSVSNAKQPLMLVIQQLIDKSF